MNIPDAQALLDGMTTAAREYIRSFAWCPPIRRMAMIEAVPGLIGLVRTEFTSAIEGTDRELWVVVGNIPSAYFVYEGNENPRDALEQYCLLMEDWARAVRDGASIEECFPVDAVPTPETAEDLRSRIGFIRAEVLAKIST